MVRSEARPIERPVPMTWERAATAVAQSRGHVRKAIDDMMLAIDILRRSGTGSTVAELEEVLGRLEEVELALHQARA